MAVPFSAHPRQRQRAALQLAQLLLRGRLDHGGVRLVATHAHLRSNCKWCLQRLGPTVPLACLGPRLQPQFVIALLVVRHFNEVIARSVATIVI